MAKPDISQTAEARRLESEANRLYAVYTDVAAAVTVAWKLAGRPRPGGYFDPKSKAYSDYQNMLEDKQEAFQNWQRAASRHGHYLLPKAKDE
jgi:hypothetical protein